MLTEPECQLLLSDWNDTATNFAEGGQCLHELFQSQAVRTPDVPAVEFTGQTLTYRELDHCAERVAEDLRRHGVGPEVLVGLCLPRSLDLVIVLLGILKAGGAYVPVDPDYPPERIVFMLAEANTIFTITNSEFAARLPVGTAKVTVEQLDGRTADLPVGAHPARAATHKRRSPDDAALCVLFTSGSTGRPKGIVLPHRTLTNLVLWHRETMLHPRRMLQFASISFDASVHEIFVALCTGGTIVLIPEDLRNDIDQLAHFVSGKDIDKVNLPVVVLQEWASLANRDRSLFPALREITTTGEKLVLTKPVVKFFAERPDIVLHNHYGPTETHVATAETLGGAAPTWALNPSIGRPIANTEIYILDSAMRVVPIGVVGELYIGGAGLARGYLNRPDLTRERFVPHPFDHTGTARLYRTGDLARYRDDGRIEFLGRADQQVKLRGFRIELGEVEAVLGQHELVRDVAVVLDQRGADPRLVAYFLSEDDVAVSEADLRQHARVILPDYMVPAVFIRIDEFPLTPNGKLDKAALPEPNGGFTGASAPVETPTQRRLAGIWSHLLERDPGTINRTDDFFDLGGHSLLVTRMLAQVHEQFDVNVPVRVVFGDPALSAIARFIDDHANKGMNS